MQLKSAASVWKWKGGEGGGRNGLQALRLRLEGSGSVGRYAPSAPTNETETQRSFTCQHFFACRVFLNCRSDEMLTRRGRVGP